jgi:hypothetical protein
MYAIDEGHGSDHQTLWIFSGGGIHLPSRTLAAALISAPQGKPPHEKNCYFCCDRNLLGTLAHAR